MDQSVTPSNEPERWLPVASHEGLYEVSNLGCVKSFQRASPRILKPIRRYYNVVGLYKDGKVWQRTIHSLVAEAFIGPRRPGQEVCHGPGGRYDNRLANLSYGTRAENVEDMRRDGTLMVGTRVHFARLTDEAVLECRARAAGGERPADLAREFGVSWNAVYCAVSGKTWRHLPMPDGADLIPRRPAAAAGLKAKRPPRAIRSPGNAPRPLNSRNTSGYRGVHLHHGKWEVRIKAGGRRICLGAFGDLIEAARAYNEAALKYFGEAARLNLIPDATEPPAA